ncbi:hypothetical protein OAD06_07215 [Flavobacteriaceae bacterium]|jgi:hypothetical protein|nr:hypothetical protein [Flavobacteriaceae bacterium]MDA9025454.1 hypothetical protein [bacterium]MDB9914075.1 hypothetical protein [Flavobacteriaceae bacterium]MDB9989492.1 hypothetical protein [Flavobacteriaceae bacterium]MDB9993057.1 hypothetical protein [Flavobacteriaceae bacterium]
MDKGKDKEDKEGKEGEDKWALVFVGLVFVCVSAGLSNIGMDFGESLGKTIKGFVILGGFALVIYILINIRG